MKSLRTAVWLAYVPVMLGATWLLTRLMMSLAALVTFGHVDTQAVAGNIARTALPYAGLGALAMYVASVVFLKLRKVRPFVVCAEIGSIGAAEALGLLAVMIHAHGDAPYHWISLTFLCIGWLAIERRGAWPWRRAARMLVLVVGVFLVIQNASHLPISASMLG